MNLKYIMLFDCARVIYLINKENVAFVLYFDDAQERAELQALDWIFVCDLLILVCSSDLDELIWFITNESCTNSSNSSNNKNFTELYTCDVHELMLILAKLQQQPILERKTLLAS